MATITVSEGFLDVTFTRSEQLFGFLRNLRYPLAEVVEARVEDPWRTLTGLRAPGLAWPRKRLIGHWRHRGRRKTLVSVTYGQPAVRVVLDDPRTDLLLGADDAIAIATLINDARQPTA